MLLHFYRKPALSLAKKDNLLSFIRQRISPEIRDIETEYCFNIETSEPLSSQELETLHWLLSETFEPENFSDKSFLTHHSGIASPSARNDSTIIFELGPRMNFTTAWSTNAVSVCHACGLKKVTRIERSKRYKIVRSQKSLPLNPPLSKGGNGGVSYHPFNLQPSTFNLF